MAGKKNMNMQVVMRAALMVAVLALLGCAGSGTPVNPANGNSGTPGVRGRNTQALHRNNWRGFTHEQRLQLKRDFRNTMPPHVYAALAQLGMPQSPQAVTPVQSGKGTSVVLPHFFDANTQYVNPGDAGYVTVTSGVTINPGPPPIGGVDLLPPGTAFPGNFAAAVYRVDDIVGQIPSSLSVNLGLSLGDVGVGVYNWAYGSNGRWEPLYYGPGVGTVVVDMTLVPGAQWMNGNDDLAFTVFCLNPNQVSVSSFQLSEGAANQDPVADLIATPPTGQAPLDAQLDASGSFDPDGTVVQYVFDPEGDGNLINNGAVPVLDYQYANPGSYMAQVEVMDNDGALATFSTQVFVTPLTYDETEDNDDKATANAVPALPFSNFSGNGGVGGPEDGDSDDWFLLSGLNPGDNVHFELAFDEGGGANAFTIFLWDTLTPFALAQSFGGQPAQLDYTFTGGEVSPFYIEVVCDAGMSDYFLSGELVVTPPSYDEFEDNDDDTQADFHGDLSFTGAEIDWTGSLGTGGSDYDGDTDDWSYFDNSGSDYTPGTDINLNLSYDNGTGTIGFTLFDAFGVQLDFSADGDGSEDIAYTVQPGDTCPFFLQFNCASGFSDYVFSGTSSPPNPGFDETEHNDTIATANALPAFPVVAFTGNIGDAGSYDGDTQDYFSFSGSAGEMFTFTVTPADTSVELQAIVYESGNSATIGGGVWDSGTGILTVNAQVRSSDSGPFVVELSNFTGIPSDYTIDGDLSTTFLEIEDNDNNGEATSLPNNYYAFTASLGSPGYDGDNSDFFSFFAADGAFPIHDIVYDDVQGTISATIFDSDGDIMGQSVDQGNGVLYCDFDNAVDAADTQPFYLVVDASSGSTNYWLRNYNSYGL
ncbi:MAG: PKD domain-containing protein [bacterium]|nr:PKD domain-containing protein [bacterium]